ncbi:hypothetical protein ACKLNO_00940 [Neisseriaceae bacterium B1]
MSFETSFDRLKQLNGFQSAAIINTDNKTILAQTQSAIEMNAAAIGWSYSLKLEHELLEKLETYDLMRSCMITTKKQCHILTMVPYFDGVVLYTVFNRDIPYLFVNDAILEAVDLMI